MRFDYQKTVENVINQKKSGRSQEIIIGDIINEIQHINKIELLLYATCALWHTSVFERESSPLFANLLSPSKQIPYLIDLLLSMQNEEQHESMSFSKWQKISRLLDEIEYAYASSIVFTDDGQLYVSSEEAKITGVANNTFRNFYSNSELVFEEQVREKISLFCSPYDDLIYREFGFRIADIYNFIDIVKGIVLDKLQDTNDYCNTLIGTNEYKEYDSFNWFFYDHLSGFPSKSNHPGTNHLLTFGEILRKFVDEGTLKHIIQFLEYSPTISDKIHYYTDDSIFLTHPLIVLGQRIIVPHSRVLIDAFLLRLNFFLKESDRNYLVQRNKSVENKCVLLFKKLFGKEVEIYQNYYLDKQFEQDLLVVYNNTCLIVEIKDCSFRQPMRDPVKAYVKIEKDFKSSIQKGYDQCLRVEKALWANDSITIYDKRGKKYTQLNTKRIIDCYSIIVTSYRYGPIQNDLWYMLKKDDDALFPWSVSIDDLENFILLLIRKEKNKGRYRQLFLNYLKYREGFHGRLACMDELEMCGWFICNERDFITYSQNTLLPLRTTPDMSDIFDAYYLIGLGFDNELNLDHKIKSIPKFADDFEIILYEAKGNNTFVSNGTDVKIMGQIVKKTNPNNLNMV